jgi:hypothetical protein
VGFIFLISHNYSSCGRAEILKGFRDEILQTLLFRNPYFLSSLAIIVKGLS